MKFKYYVHKKYAQINDRIKYLPVKKEEIPKEQVPEVYVSRKSMK